MTIMGFSGTRIGMTDIQKAAVTDLFRVIGPPEIHHGDCQGADEEFHRIAAVTGVTRIVVHPPTNPTLRAFCKGDVVLEPLPYHDRNRAIVANCGLLVAAPQSAYVAGGTWWTIKEAERQGRRTIIIYPDGRVVDRGGDAKSEFQNGIGV